MNAVTAEDAEHRREQPRRLNAVKHALVSLPSWLRIALAAYVVVAQFGLAYLLVSLAWSGLSSSATLVVAVLIAAPLALGLIWPRLTGFKAFGLEVSLAHVTVQLDTKLAAVITSRDLGSRAPDLVQQMEAIVQSEVELFEINLRDGSYWWSTRLYLLAALAQDLSDVRAFAFVRGGADRRFVGIAAPTIVRRALARQTPELETTYLNVAGVTPIADAKSRVRQIVFSWTASSFGSPPAPEGDFATLVSPETLFPAVEAIGGDLEADSVDWPGYADSTIVRALVRDFDGEYVALLRAGSLDRIVNRRALAAQIAIGTV